MIHKFKLGGFNALLDVNSGGVHIIDDLTYDLLDNVEPPFEEKCPEDVVKKLSKMRTTERRICFSKVERHDLDMIKDVQEKILQLKKENDICILAHSYQAKEIVEIADITGDSYKLSVEAQKVSNKNILMCGVHFMAEAAKMLNPDT